MAVENPLRMEVLIGTSHEWYIFHCHVWLPEGNHQLIMFYAYIFCLFCEAMSQTNDTSLDRLYMFIPPMRNRKSWGWWILFLY